MSRGVMIFLALIAAGTLVYFYANSGKQQVVVYCALDREFAQPIFDEFERRTGITAVIRYDTEANKSVGLYEDLIREKDKPRCDVHWNNEVLATIRLQRQGVLEPYESPQPKRNPLSSILQIRAGDFRASDHTWTGFAARCRVIIYNKQLVAEKGRPERMEDLLAPEWKRRFAMAKPQFGTTATQAALLFATWGSEKAKDYYRKMKDNGVLILPGNKQVAESVGSGKVAFGLTDTDDAFAEVDAGNAVGIIFLKVRGNDLAIPQLIPNTVAIIKNCPNPLSAQALIDYLLTDAVENQLSLAPGRQYPLLSRRQGVVWDPFLQGEYDPKSPDLLRTDFRIDLSGNNHFKAAADCWMESQEFLAELFALR